MPGISSGLSPKIISVNTDATADLNVPVCKFPTVHTVVDAFYIKSNNLAASSTIFITMRMLNGKTTGNQTTNLAVAGYAVGGKSVAWTTYTAKTTGTNYTFSANHWLVMRYSEDGTVTDSTMTGCWHAVEGNV